MLHVWLWLQPVVPQSLPNKPPISPKCGTSGLLLLLLLSLPLYRALPTPPFRRRVLATCRLAA